MAVYSDTHRETYVHFIDSVLRGTLSNFLLDSIDNPRLRERTEVTKLITFAGNNLTHNTTHDLKGVLNSPISSWDETAYLARACLGKITNEDYFFRCGKGSDHFANLKNKFFQEGGLIVWIICEFPRSNSIWMQAVVYQEYTYGLRVTNAYTA